MDSAYLKQRADHLIRTLAGTTTPTSVTVKALVTTTPQAGPYREHTAKTYDPVGTSLIAALKMRPQGPLLSVSDINMWSIGENQNVDIVVFISKYEADLKGVAFDEMLTDFQIISRTVAYDPLLVEPRSFCENEPLYYRIKCVRTP